MTTLPGVHPAHRDYGEPVTPGSDRDQVFDEPTTRAALTTATANGGPNLNAPRLLRLGENAVYSDDHIVARVVRRSSRIDAAHTVDVAHWLETAGVPAVQALDVDQPVEADGLAVTYWHSLGDSEKYGTTTQLAHLLRRLHALPVPTQPQLEPIDPFERARRRLESPRLDDDVRTFLSDRLEHLAIDYRTVDFRLGSGVLHDDASVGNVLIDTDGVARFIDLDGVGTGPFELDLILTAIYYDRFGWHTETEYRAFCDVYGADIMQWDGYQTLADLRELLMLTWMSQNAATSEKTAREFAKRVETVRTKASRRDWSPF